MKQLLTIILLAALAPMASAADSIPITLTWSDNSTNETGFTLERKTSSIDFVVVAEIPSEDPATTGKVSWTDQVLPGAVYTYRVRAYNEFGSTDYTNEASKDYRPPDADPSDLVITVEVTISSDGSISTKTTTNQ